MQFDSYLVIVVSNTDPETLANTAGFHARDAVLDRFTGSRAAIKGGLFCPDQHSARVVLKRKLVYLLCDVFSLIGVHISTADVYNELDDDELKF